MTLPNRVLDLLTEIDPDRTRAVVKVTEAVTGARKRDFKTIDLVEMAPGKSLIVVGPNKILHRIPWLKLIEIAPVRYLLILPSGTPVETLEVALRDLLHDPEVIGNERDTALLHALLDLIGHQRRTQRMTKAEILVVDTVRERP